MRWVSRCWSAFTVFAVVFALVFPPLATGALAQEGGKVLRVHHLSYPDVVDPLDHSSLRRDVADAVTERSYQIGLTAPAG